MIVFSLVTTLAGCSLFADTPPSPDPTPAPDVNAEEAGQAEVVEAEGTFGTGAARLVLRDGVMEMYATDAYGALIVPKGGVTAMVTPVDGQAERLLLVAAGDHWEAPTRADGSPALVVLRWETPEAKAAGSVMFGDVQLPPRGARK